MFWLIIKETKKFKKEESSAFSLRSWLVLFTQTTSTFFSFRNQIGGWAQKIRVGTRRYPPQKLPTKVLGVTYIALPFSAKGQW